MIIELYNEHEKLMEVQKEKLACKASCGVCCHQLIFLSEPEWDEIEKYMYENNLRDIIFYREKEILEDWIKYRLKNLEDMRKNVMKVISEWFGKKCIFLNENDCCDIYTVRPMACRCLTSTIKCKDLNQDGCMRFRYPFEKEIQEKIWKECGHSMVIIDLYLGIK